MYVTEAKKKKAAELVIYGKERVVFFFFLLAVALLIRSCTIPSAPPPPLAPPLRCRRLVVVVVLLLLRREPLPLASSRRSVRSLSFGERRGRVEASFAALLVLCLLVHNSSRLGASKCPRTRLNPSIDRSRAHKQASLMVGYAIGYVDRLLTTTTASWKKMTPPTTPSSSRRDSHSRNGRTSS